MILLHNELNSNKQFYASGGFKYNCSANELRSSFTQAAAVAHVFCNGCLVTDVTLRNSANTVCVPRVAILRIKKKYVFLAQHHWLQMLMAEFVNEIWEVRTGQTSASRSNVFIKWMKWMLRQWGAWIREYVHLLVFRLCDLQRYQVLELLNELLDNVSGRTLLPTSSCACKYLLYFLTARSLNDKRWCYRFRSDNCYLRFAISRVWTRTE